MKYGSMCSGIEAATQAWHHMGWKPSFFSEIDAFPCAVLQHHYPKVPLHGDFTTIQDGDYEPINLLVGGTPCQSFSVAGLRKGLDDPRGNLMLGFGALAKRLRPTWLVWENVPGVLSANGGRDFGTFLGMLAELGYGFAYRVLDAQFFGVAQRRKRVFVVGYLGDWRPAAAVLFERESLSGNPAPSRESKEDVAGTFKACASSGGWSNSVDHAAAGYMQPVNTYQNVSHCLNAGVMGRIDYETESSVVHGTQDPCTGSQAFALGRNNGAENAFAIRTANTSSNGCGLSPEGPAYTLDHSGEGQAVAVSLRGREGGATAELGGPIAGTLRASSGGGDKPHVLAVSGQVAHTLRGEGFDASEDGTGRGTPIVAFSLQAGTTRENPNSGPDGVGVQVNTAYTLEARTEVQIASYGMAVRRLIPVECERLQGFPDNFTQIPYRGKTADKCPDGPRYKALGNSMAVPCMKWIGERIQQVQEITEKNAKEIAA
jgi:DNA (cytosine-5)-methyltransferase 1